MNMYNECLTIDEVYNFANDWVLHGWEAAQNRIVFKNLEQAVKSKPNN